MAPSNTEHPGWLQISIEINPIAHESLSAFLFNLGCKGVVTEGEGDRTVKAYLPFQDDPKDIRSRSDIFLQSLKEIFPEIDFPKLKLNRIEEQDWSLNWRRFFRPDRITPGLMTVPAWESVPKSFEGHTIRIDPGPAFGTGQHPTTRMCLEAMEKVSPSGSWTMLDVGTGSGILAIYAVKLGAKSVEAIDIDPEAVRWAERNFELNSVSGAIELSQTPLEEIVGTFSILAANLILGEIMGLFPHFPRLLIPGGWLILSGILGEQVEVVERELNSYEFREREILHSEEWACIITRKGGEE